MVALGARLDPASSHHQCTPVWNNKLKVDSLSSLMVGTTAKASQEAGLMRSSCWGFDESTPLTMCE